MKTVISILLFSFFWILGCDSSPDLSVNSEENNSTGSKTFEKIKLPSPSNLWKDSLITMSQTIDGSVGGRLILDKYYMSENGDSILVKVDLRIPADAFQGTKTITITVDQTDAAVHFYPAMVFADTLRLFQSFEGLNLDGYSTGTIDFVYIRDDGTAELLKKNGTQIILPQGIMRVQNAKLNHFSRYGWVRSPN
jgi:hypothetical protein